MIFKSEYHKCICYLYAVMVYTNCTRSSPLLNRVLCAPVRNNMKYPYP